MVAPIRDVDRAGAIDSHASGTIEPRRAASAVVRSAVVEGRACEGRDDPSGRDLANRIVAPICDVDRAGAVRRYASGAIEPRGVARAVLVAPGEIGVTGQRGDHPGGRDLANRVIAPVRNIKVAGAVYRHVIGTFETRGAARAIVRAVGAGATRERGYDPGRRDFANRGVAVIRNIDRAGAVHRHASGKEEPRRGAGAIVRTLVADNAGKCGHHAGGRDLADRLVALIDDVDIPRSVHREASRAIELGRGPRAVDRAWIFGRTGQDGDDSGGRDLADRMAVRFRDVHIPRAVHGHASRTGKPPGGGRKGRERIGRGVVALGVEGGQRGKSREKPGGEVKDDGDSIRPRQNRRGESRALDWVHGRSRGRGK